MSRDQISAVIPQQRPALAVLSVSGIGGLS
jgi:hypothetical protein